MDTGLLMEHDDAASIDIIPKGTHEPGASTHCMKDALTQWDDEANSVGELSVFRHRLFGGHAPLSARQLFRTLLMDPVFDPAATDGDSQQEGDSQRAIASVVTKRRAKRKPKNSDNCQRIRELMPDYILRSLPEDDRSTVVKHIRRCRECYAIMTSLENEIAVAAEHAE